MWLIRGMLFYCFLKYMDICDWEIICLFGLVRFMFLFVCLIVFVINMLMIRLLVLGINLNCFWCVVIKLFFIVWGVLKGIFRFCCVLCGWIWVCLRMMMLEGLIFCFIILFCVDFVMLFKVLFVIVLFRDCLNCCLCIVCMFVSFMLKVDRIFVKGWIKIFFMFSVLVIR